MDYLARRRRMLMLRKAVPMIAGGLGLLAVIAVMVWVLGDAIDNSIDNQNTMLCNSALKSGNTEYLEKCSTFYQTNDIKYMRGL